MTRKEIRKEAVYKAYKNLDSIYLSLINLTNDFENFILPALYAGRNYPRIEELQLTISKLHSIFNSAINAIEEDYDFAIANEPPTAEEETE
jgi:hypothetical protein